MSLLPWFIRVVEMRVVLLLQKPKISREGMFDNWRFQNRALRHGVTFVRINTLGSTFCDGGRALFGFISVYRSVFTLLLPVLSISPPEA